MISFSSATLTDGLVSYYNLDDVSGEILDSLGLFNGTYNGTLYSQPGIIDTAIGFDGIDDIVIIGDTGVTGAWTINTWVSPETVTGIDYAIHTTGLGGVFTEFSGATPTGSWGYYDGTNVFNGGSVLPLSTYSMLTVTKTAGNDYELFLNGTSVTTGAGVDNDLDNIEFGKNGDNAYKGDIDETAIYSRQLSDPEITQLWNDGDGITYPFGVSFPFIDLNSPLNNTTISDIGANFTVSGDVTSNFNTTNITYYIWQNNSLFNQTTVILTADQTFNETLFIDNFTLDEYKWNAQICYGNSTFNNCTFAENNFTFSVNIFKDISSNYSTEITEGASNTITRTISIFPGNVLTGGLLEYNGTNYSTSLVFSGGIYIVGASIVAPVVNDDINFTFRFYYLINDIYYPSEEVNQTVLNTLFGICGGVSNDTLLNLFLLDEGTKNNLTGNIEINAEVVSMTSGETVGVLNGSFNDVDNVSICFTPPSVYASYYLNAEIRYTATNYVAELYYIQKSDLENYPSNLSLYLLNQSDSTEFSITYKNNDFIFTEGAIVQLQRKYIGDSAYQTVEAPITSNGGKAILHIDLNSNIYRASVVKDGVLLDFFENIVFSCDNELSGDCTYSLDGTVNPNNDVPITEITDFVYSININESAKTITVLFAVPSGNPSVITVALDQIDMFGNFSSCNTTVVTSAGSITCGYTDTIEKSILELSISKDDVQLAVLSYVNDPELDMDGMNFFIVFLFMISLVGMAIASPEWMILISVMVLLISGTLLLVNGMNLVMGLGAIAWVIIAAAIMIFKMARQEDR